MCLIEFIKCYKDLILVSCAIITTLLAFIGVWTWKRQIVGTSKYQLARDFSRKLLLFHRYFKTARERRFWEFEYPKGHEHAEDFEIQYSILKKRLDTLNGVFTELEYLATEYSVLTGNVNLDILKDLRIKRNEYRVAIDDYIEAIENNYDRQGDFYYRVFSLNNDEFGESIDDEVIKLFKRMSKHIRFFSIF